jgi:pyridoxamine 5'-phosphate oxidase
MRRGWTNARDRFKVVRTLLMTKNTDINPPADPWALFEEWYALAQTTEPNDPNAMTLATVGAHGMPSARVVLMKGHNPEGFVFYTNRNSHKGDQLARHPKAALCFYWKSLRRQVRAEGSIAPVSDSESDTYFTSRPRGAQIGAWASDQSRALESRGMLERKVQEFEAKFADKPVPRPPHWGGYRLTPLLIEFWQDREFRLHDRILYRRAEGQSAWAHERLYP